MVHVKSEIYVTKWFSTILVFHCFFFQHDENTSYPLNITSMVDRYGHSLVSVTPAKYEQTYKAFTTHCLKKRIVYFGKSNERGFCNPHLQSKYILVI